MRPENRLVADALEQQWNEKLSQLARVEEEYTQACKADGLEVSTQAREHILALASDLPRVWKDRRTSARDRKRMLRLLVEDVTLIRDRKVIHIAIRWKGGATTELDRPVPPVASERFRTPADIVERIRALATEQTAKEIARTLNRRCLRAGRGNKFTCMSVKAIRRAYQIDSLYEHLRKQGWLTAKETAAQLEIHYQTAKNYAIAGVLEARRVNDKDEILFAPITGPLPKVQQGKPLRDCRRYPPCARFSRASEQWVFRVEIRVLSRVQIMQAHGDLQAAQVQCSQCGPNKQERQSLAEVPESEPADCTSSRHSRHESPPEFAVEELNLRLFLLKLCCGTETSHNQVQTRNDIQFVVSDTSGGHQIIRCGRDERTWFEPLVIPVLPAVVAIHPPQKPVCGIHRLRGLQRLAQIAGRNDRLTLPGAASKNQQSHSGEVPRGRFEPVRIDSFGHSWPDHPAAVLHPQTARQPFFGVGIGFFLAHARQYI